MPRRFFGCALPLLFLAVSPAFAANGTGSSPRPAAPQRAQTASSTKASSTKPLARKPAAIAQSRQSANRTLGGPVVRLAQFDARSDERQIAQAPVLGGPAPGNAPPPGTPFVPSVTYAGATDQKPATGQPPAALGAAPFDLGRIRAIQVGSQAVAETPLRVGNLDIMAPLVEEMPLLGASVSKVDARALPDVPGALDASQFFQLNVAGHDPIVMQIGKDRAWIKKIEQPLRSAPLNVDGKLYLPVFSVAPLIGAATRLNAQGTLVLTPTVQSVELFPVKDRVVAVTIKTSAPVPEGGFKIVTSKGGNGQAPKIWIDFSGYSMGFDAENTTLERVVGRETGNVRSARAAQPQFFPDVTRVVLDLKKPLVATTQRMSDPTLFALVLTDQSAFKKPNVAPPVSAYSNAPLRGWKIVVDPGHGGKDTGARGKRSNEKQHTLDISRRLANHLRARGATVLLTREGDSYPSLQGRVDFAHGQEADLFISVHINANVSSKSNGTETFFYTGISRPLATYVHRELVPATGRKNRGVSQRKFWVISRTRMPAVLLECAFISNPTEENRMMDARWRESVAQGVARGVGNYARDFPLDDYVN